MPALDPLADLVAKVQRNLYDCFLLPEQLRQRKPGDSPLKGHCYIACETIYYMRGGKVSGLQPYRCQTPTGVHWWLVDANGKIIDPTAAQFENPQALYPTGEKAPFLTPYPSKRCLKLMSWLRPKP